MRLVKRNDIGEKYIDVAPIPPAVAKLLQAKWRGEAIDRAAYGQIVKDYREKQIWVACDCLDTRDGPSAAPPILLPVQHDGEFHLRRATKRSEHDSSCVFHWEEGELSAPGATAGGSRERRELDFLMYTREDATASAGGEEGANTGNGRIARNALQERMFALLADAELNTINHQPQPTAWVELDNVAKRIRVVGDIRLNEILWCRPDAVTKHWAVNRFRDFAKQQHWPEKLPIQGFVLTSASEIDGKTIRFGTQGEITVETPVALSGRQNTSGPFLVMISLRFDRQKRSVRAMRAYAHPRFSERPTHEWAYVPVDSDMERKALGALLWVAKKGASAGIQISIEKPLFDITPIGADRSCRPDFLVHYGGKTLVIETMGSADPEYLEQKSRTHPTMAMLGKLILDNRATGDADKANKILIRQVIEGLRELGAPWPAAT